MRRGPPESVSPGRILSIGKCSGIDQQVAALRPRYNAQRVGMTVTGAKRTERTGVHEAVYGAASHHYHSGIRELQGIVVREQGFYSGSACRRTQPPDGEIVEFLFAADPLRAIEEAAAGCERGRAETLPGPIRVKETAAIVISDKREQTAWAQERFEIQRHAFQGTVIRFGGPRQNGVEQKHIQSVDMIITGLFEVAAIRADLLLHLLPDYPRAEPLPSP